MRIKIYQETSKVNKMGKAPLKFSVHLRKQFWLPAYESIKLGALRKQRVTAKEEFQSEINRSLEFRRRQIEKIVRHAEENGIKINQEYLSKEYKKKVGPKPIHNTTKALSDSLTDFWDYWYEFLRTGKSKYSKEHLRKFQQVRYHLECFNPSLDLENIDETFENDYFFHYLIETKELSNNTVSKHLKCLRSVLTYAERMGCKRVLPAYKNYKDISVSTKRMFLSWDEVQQIQNFESLFELDKLVKDLFLFSCYTGLRWQDIHTLTPNNFIERDHKIYLDFHSLKSKRHMSTVLPKPAVLIASKFFYELPKISNQKCNEALKRIGRGAGLKNKFEKTKYLGSKKHSEIIEKWELLSMHVGRHTFACEFLNRTKEHGLSALKALSEILGHSSTRTTEVYWSMISAEKDEMLFESFG